VVLRCAATPPRHANLSGVPIMRPLWYEFPDQPDLYGVQQEFLLGPGMLVRPVTQVGGGRGGAWQGGGEYTAD
jgi:alpha-glucosidase (family GH31 glycosyl hydrolase)